MDDMIRDMALIDNSCGITIAQIEDSIEVGRKWKVLGVRKESLKEELLLKSSPPGRRGRFALACCWGLRRALPLPSPLNGT
jgi:hypothetical protein